MYKVIFNEKAEKQFSKLDKPVRQRIASFLNNEINGSTNPRRLGIAMQGEYKGLWRYRVGGYRIIAEIVDEKFIVTVVKLGKRGQIYNR